MTDLGERKIDCVMLAVRTCAPGKFFGDVGCSIQRDIVNDNKLIVFGHDDILFNVVGTHGIGHRLGFERVLGEITACAAMGDDDLLSECPR